MQVFHYRPNKELFNYVERIWGWESEPNESVPLPTLLPGTGAELVFHYRKPFKYNNYGQWINAPRMHLICGRRKSVSLAPSGDLGFIAVRFRAGSLALLTNVCMNEFADRLVSATSLLGAKGERIVRRMNGCSTQIQRAACLEEEITDMFLRPRGDEDVSSTIDHIYRRCETARISDITDAIGLNQRSLERRVLRTTGQTLVEIRTASRVQKTIRKLLLEPTAQIAESAATYGFHDQSHFTHAMRAFGLPPPARFLRHARGMTNFYNPSVCSTGSLSQ